MERLLVNSVGPARKATFAGRDFYVVPMTLVVPGVLNGSKGAYYYPAEELKKDPSIWNGLPLVVDHPVRDGVSISARNPEVLNGSGIGYVFNAKYVTSKQKGQEQGKLVAEGWFDVALTRKVNQGVYNSLKSNTTIELSTGLYAETDPAPYGAIDNKGRAYKFIARNYQGDHVAILPSSKGACSVEDGCGVMVNCAGTCTCSDWDMEALPLVHSD